MKKTRELSEAEIFYIQEKSKDGMTADEISTAIKVPVDLLVPHLHKKRVKETKTTEAYVRKTAGGRGGVVIATQAASEHGETKPVVPNRDMSRFVTTTKGD